MIRFDTKKDMEHYDNLYHQIYEKDKEIERLKKYEKAALDTLESATYENINLINEVDRLNNIINGMGKFFKYAYDNEVRPLNDRKVSVWTICLDKLQELKGDSSNE